MSLAKTYLQDIRVNYPSELDRDELRIVQAGLMTSVLEMTNAPGSIISGELKMKAEMSQGRNLDVPVLKKGNITIKNVRSCVIGGGRSESDLVRITWKTLVADVMMVPGEYAKNEIGYTADLAKKIRETAEAFMIEIENDLDTALDANKSQVYKSTIVGDDYPLTGNAIQVVPDAVDEFFFDLDAINYADEFMNSKIKIVANHRVMSIVNKLMNPGGGSIVDTVAQFPGKDFRYSNRISNGTGVKATGYFMPDGSIGLLTRVDIDARMNHSAGDGTEWMEETIPGLPFTIGIQYKSKCSDQSALETAGLEHLKATKVEHWQLSFDFAVVVPYNSDIATKPSSIRKFEFVPTV